MPSKQQILTLDIKLRDPRAENATWSSTRTLLEHQVVLWDPSYLVHHYGKTTKYRGCFSLSDDGTAEFQRDEARRAREFRDFLALGRLLVVLAPKPITFYTATGETRNIGTKAKPRLQRIVTDRSISDLVPGGVSLTAASGTSCEVVGGEAFSAFWRSAGEQFSYVSILEGTETPLLTIKETSHVIAGLSTVEGGQVLFLPERYTFTPSDEFAKKVEGLEDEDELWEREQEQVERDTDGELLDALFELAANLSDGPKEALPGWSERYLLPREKKAIQAVEKAARKADLALKAVEQAKLELVEMRDWKRLLSGGGSELEAAVEKAFVALGCTVEAGRDGRADRVIRWKGKVAVAEIKGLSKSAGEKNAAQLEKWVSEHAIETGESPKGLLIVNAWRNTPPNERDQPSFPDQMRPYSEQRDHCLVTTSQLLAAALHGTSVKKRDSFLAKLFNTSGVLEGWTWEEAITVVSDSAE